MVNEDPYPDPPTEAGWRIYTDHCMVRVTASQESFPLGPMVEVRNIEAKSSIVLTVSEAQNLRDVLRHAIDFASIPAEKEVHA